MIIRFFTGSNNEIEKPSKLREAIKNSDIETIILLLENGSDVNELDSLGISPLKEAVQDNNKDIVELLLNHGADANIDNVLVTIGYYKNIDIKIVELLLENGANPYYVNNFGDNLIHSSIKNGRSDVIDLLIEYGADINGTNFDHGETPLHQQCYTGTSKTVEILLDRGADINIQTNKGGTPLMVACSQEEINIDIIKLLLDRGADIDIANYEGATPLIFASFRGHINAINLLLEYGADKNIQCDTGENIITAFDAAKNSGHIEAANLIHKY